LRAVSSGDLGALGELYDRYARDVWRAVRRSLADPADVEDIVHGVFMKLPQLAASYDGRPMCRAWLCGVAVRLAMRHRRGLGRFQRMLRGFAGSNVAPASATPEQNASDREELLCFERALARLSAKKRAVFVLVELEGLSSEEAAAALEIPAATVRTRLFHARREIDDTLGRGLRS
jgi:RNA polymerase sigma-70 factor (ECF subfamily)